MNIAVFANLNFHTQIKQTFEFFEKINNLNFKKFFFENTYDAKNVGIINEKKIKFDIALFHNTEKTKTVFNSAANFKKLNQNCEVIFSSFDEQLAVEGYKINLTAYLLWPFNFEEFSFVLKKCLEKSTKKNKYITINSGWQKILIKTDTIQFAEKIAHNVVIHTSKDVFSTRITLSEFLKKFENNQNFVHCVRGALVNLKWVDRIENQNFLMKTGDRISIRRKDRKKIRQIYNNFVLNSNEQTL